ncbi:MAG: hypothetical protein HYZ00_14845, partial [Candidatus Hydrogenedentes bacterium]|nr:hypothetical protein [Candidatus Hydrogenedentota bacterium]
MRQIIVLLLVTLCTPALGLTLYVAPPGHPVWSQPEQERKVEVFATLEEARDAVRKLREAKKLQREGVEVVLME